jgi:hypothetical protein
MTTAEPVFDVPSRRWTEAKRYVPVLLPSGDTNLWMAAGAVALARHAVRLLAVRWYFQFLAYLARWEYASHKPAATGRHAKPEERHGPRHVYKTSLLEQLGISQRAWETLAVIEDKLDAAPKVA